MTVEYLREMRDLLTADGTLVANTFSSSNLYHHESNSYRQVFGDFINYRRKDTGNRVVLIPQAQRDGDARTRLTKEQLMARAQELDTNLRPYGVPIIRIAREVAAASRARPDWNLRKRPLSDQYSPANLLRKR